MEDRIKGSVVAKFLGDAIGAPYEFVYNRKLPYSDVITLSTRHRSRWQGERNTPPGQVTDDSEMTIALMLSLLDRDEYDAKEATRRYIEWVNSGTYMLGINTRVLFKGIKAKKLEKQLDTFTKRYTKKFDHAPQLTTSSMTRFQQVREDATQSNGSLMRCSPLAVFESDEPALIDCQLTNPTDVNRDASLVYTHAIRACFKGERSKKRVFIQAKRAAQTDAIIEALTDAREGNSERDIAIKNKGWVAHAIYATFYAFLHFDDFPSAMRWIVQEKSGDTDTNAAIAGALIGAYYGYEALMADETTAQNWKIVCEVDTSKGDNPRNDQYHPRNIDHLIARLCAIAKIQLEAVEEDDDSGGKRRRCV